MTNKLTLGIGILTAMTVVSCYPPKNPSYPTQPQAAEKPAEQIVENVEETIVENTTSSNPAESTPSVKPSTPKPTYTSPTSSSSSPTTSSTTSSSLPKETTLSTPAYKPPVETVPTIVPKIKPKSFPYAAVVPGKPGFVFNPYNQKKVDVRGLPAGTLVSDPRDATQKFYVP